MARTFEAFVKEVKDSCEAHAKRKNYAQGNVDDDNQLAGFISSLKIHNPHAIGEIICKCVEFLKDPKPLLVVKIAGWAWMIYKYLPE